MPGSGGLEDFYKVQGTARQEFQRREVGVSTAARAKPESPDPSRAHSFAFLKAKWEAA